MESRRGAEQGRHSCWGGQETEGDEMGIAEP